MKIAKICLALIILTALVAGSARAQIPGVIIYPQQLDEGQVVEVDAGESIGIGVDWSACNRAMVDIAVRVSHINLWLDGATWPPQAETSRTAFPANRAAALEKEPFVCMGHVDIVYGFAIIFGLGVLPPGDHTLRTVWRLDHPVPTGADQDGDGRPEIYRGTYLDRTITIRVLAP